MKISKEDVERMTPTGTKFIFKWVKPKDKKGLIVLPDDVYNPTGTRLGRTYFIEIVRVSPKCEFVKPGLYGAVSEHCRILDVDAWNENEFYIAEEEEVKYMCSREHIESLDVQTQAGLIPESPHKIRELEKMGSLESKSRLANKGEAAKYWKGPVAKKKK